METIYTITVTNDSPFEQNFFFFQQPAKYVGNQTVYSNSIYQDKLSSTPTYGTTLTFQFALQYYAGAQTAVSAPTVGTASGFQTAVQPIEITKPGSAASNNSTNLLISPLGLSPPTYTPGVQPGSFRITAPQYDPKLKFFNVGLATKNVTGGSTLSNFIQAQPLQNVDVQPIVTFYVATGAYQPGTVINFTSSSVGSAICDATPGYTNFDVIYNADGSWKVTSIAPKAKALYFPGLTQLQGEAYRNQQTGSPQVINVNILNEAGTAVIATGQAPNLNLPVTVSNVNPAGVLAVGNEYQLQSGTGTPVGAMCIGIAGGNATFR